MAQPIEAITISVPEAARLMSIGRTTFYKLRKIDPHFPRLRKYGRASRVVVDELREWIDKHAIQLDSPAPGSNDRKR